ncbi:MULTISPECIES: chromate efflux transporter [Empedobacter]|uniref:Chromate efflux transporter n=1 Tax=Empedobacter falsenii TaxID=343874 RepID=A0A427BDK7_9FLAO|nr:MULTISPECIES: chromate efflux transporter [Empedobacter]MDH0660487.1 chromate efflux transporter [Empedobacter sp. GD03865]MDH0674645.1 chromate efflux transporter [Empedobacter sp. GD03861]MDH1603521.1 chromate efflux transporter [Empedobacter sp. GD03739]MDH1883839.1 chromate efflux transporter [Empedobacter sp. GD03797]MDM1043146.1 chromate efflux transporter [Empedobacter brevis]
MDQKIQIKEIAKLFFKLGVIGFGGPAAHIAMMQREVVVKRQWMSDQHFLDLLGATNLIPGPNSTEMAIHIGYDKGGWKGLLVAGLCFIFPAVLITGIFAYFYQKYGQIPEVSPFLYGIKPAIIAIIIGAVYPLFLKAIKNVYLGVLAIAVLVLSLLGINEIFLLVGAGFFMLLEKKFRQLHSMKSFVPLALFPLFNGSFLSTINQSLFWTFLKIGSILYGSGYVLFAFLDTELVDKGLLTRIQLMDAIAVGQFTPGPVFSSVTFIGYQINGLSGAIVSTLAIFLPSFILVALIHPLMKFIRNNDSFSTFLNGVNVASVAIILSVCIVMGKETITDWRTIVIALISAVIVFQFKKINSAFIVLLGSILGYLIIQF